MVVYVGLYKLGYINGVVYMGLYIGGSKTSGTNGAFS